MSYTEKQLENFYKAMEQLPENVAFEQVSQWVAQPGAVPRLPSKAVLTLNKMLMLSFVIAVTSALLWFLVPDATKINAPAAGHAARDTNRLEPSAVGLLQDSLVDSQNISESIADTLQVANLSVSKKTEPRESDFTKQPPGNPVSCSWPQDTIIYISDLLVTLDLEEMEPLGFLIVNNGLSGTTLEEMERRTGGYYYKNRFEGVVSTFYHQITGFSSNSDMLNSFETEKNIKETFSEFDFYPVAAENAPGKRQFFKPTYWIDGFRENFEEIRYELVPVRFKVSGELESTTYYFKSSPEFFNRLPKRFAQWKETYQCIKKLHEQTGKQVLRYTWDILQEKGQYLYLDQSYLEQLGFHFSDTSVTFAYENDMNCGYEWILGAKVSRNRMPRSQAVKAVSRLNPLFMTNTKGELAFTSACREFNPVSDQIGNIDLFGFDQKYELLIPVVLSQSIYPWLNGDRIIWYEPSDSLFAKLPPELGAQIKSDYEYLTSTNKMDLEAKCTYFTVCESEVKINEFIIYPNPASSYVNVFFEFSESMKATLAVYDLQGKVLVQHAINQTYSKGEHTERLELAGLNAGVYIVRLSTGNGFRTLRLIVTD